MQAGALQMKFLADMTDLQRKFGQAQELAQQTANRIGGFFTGMGARIAGGLSVAGLGAFVQASIKAADEVGKIAQRTGIAVKDIGGLQLAWRQSGASAEQFVPIMAKVSTAIANGNDALKAMGIQTRNTDGTLKSTREVLGEVSDKFASYSDGAGKTALAVKLLGEEGAKALPFLNGGSQALAEYDEMARRLGLTLDEETTKKAAQFNDTLDLIGQSTQGVGRQIAAQLLPTLTGLAGQFFNSMTSGDRLRNTAEFLGNVLKGLYVVALGVVEVFSTVGKTFGGVAAAVAAAASGDFSMAGNILRDMKSDIGTGWKATLAEMTSAWNTTGNAGVTAMAAIAGATPPAVEATKKVGDAAKKAADEYSRWMAQIEAGNEKRRAQVFDARMEEEEKAEKEHYDWLKSMDEDAMKYRVKLHDKQMDAQEKAVEDAAKELEKIAEKERDAYVDMWKSIDDTAKDVFTDVANEGEDAFERIGKTLKAAILDLLYQMTVRKWIFQIAGVDAGGMGGMFGGGGGGNNITSSLMRSGGMSASNWVGNTIGGGNTGALVGGATGTMGYANVAGSLYANAATAGAATSGIAASGAGIDALLATNAAYGTASASAAGAAAGAQAGAAAGASGLAVLGWIGLIIALWEPLFGTKLKEIGKAGNFDGAGGIETSRYTHRQGGLFSSNKTYYEPLNDNNAFERQLKGIQDGMIETARVMGLGEDAIRNFSGSVNIDLLGLNAEEAAAKTKEELTKLQAQMLATASFAPAVVQSFEQIEQAALEMGLTAEEAAQHAREVTARDDAMKRQGFEQMTNYYIGLINQTEEVMNRAGITSQALADVITAGMTGRLDESQVGAQLADIVLGGIYNTIAGGFAAQISDVFMQQIIQPIMMAVTAGVPLTTAISSQAMATVVATAQNAAANLKAIFDDPTFRQTMADLQTTIGGIAGASVKPARSIKAFGSAALAAGDAARRAAEEQKRAAEELRRAWQAVSDSLTDEIRRIRGEILGLTAAGQAYAQSQFITATAQARAGDQDAARMLPQLARAVLDIANQTATSLGDLRAVQGATMNSLEQTRAILAQQYGLTIPAFANGGMHAGGWAMVGERGPELAYMPPAQVYSASNTRQMLGGDEEMKREMRELKAANVAMAAILKRMETKQEQVSPGGVTRVQVVTA